MSRPRYATLAVLLACACFIGIVSILKNQPGAVAELYMAARGLETNSAGSLCLRVGVTNRSGRTYGVGFAAQTKPGSGWTRPALIQHFNACPGETLNPTSGMEVLVPLPPTPGPWRVAAACFEKDEKIPTGNLGRAWRFVSMRLNRGRYLKLLATSEVSSNQTAQ